MTDIVERLRSGAMWPNGESQMRRDVAYEIERLRAERDQAREACNLAIKEMADMARQAGSWRGIAEGKDIVIQQLEAERDRLKAMVNWLNPDGLAMGPIINTKETGHE